MIIFLLSNTGILIGQNKIPDAFHKFEKIYSPELNPEYHEYNFWNGHWNVNWKSWVKLDQYRSTGYAEHRVFSALDGKAMIELAYSDSIVNGSKTAGFSIRYFDSNLEKWVMLQSWPGRNSPNISSLQGTHHHGRIQLYQHRKTSKATKKIPAGSPYVNRYTFSDALPNSFRWDSSISTDSMRTWFTGNIAEFTRIPDFDTLKEIGTDYWFTYGDGYNCDDAVLNDLRPFLGEWEGQTELLINGEKQAMKSYMVLIPFLSNCAAMGYQITETEMGNSKEIIFATYLPNSSEWVFYTLNNNKGESQILYFSKALKDGEASFTKRELFNVPSSNKIEVIKWKMDGDKKLELKAYDENDGLIYKKIMKKR